jgi:hypothetical protein
MTGKDVVNKLREIAYQLAKTETAQQREREWDHPGNAYKQCATLLQTAIYRGWIPTFETTASLPISMAPESNQQAGSIESRLTIITSKLANIDTVVGDAHYGTTAARIEVEAVRKEIVSLRNEVSTLRKSISNLRRRLRVAVKND